MTKIFKHLAKHWAACLVIIALLLVQAYGDLTLPDYTSKIVDTGIQQSGIADAVPEVVRDSTLQVLELLMTDADAAAVEAAYTQPGGTDNALSSATSLQKKLASPYTVRLLPGRCGPGYAGGRYFPPRILCSIWLPLRQPGRATPRMPRRAGYRYRPVCGHDPDARFQPGCRTGPAGRSHGSGQRK